MFCNRRCQHGHNGGPSPIEFENRHSKRGLSVSTEAGTIHWSHSELRKPGPGDEDAFLDARCAMPAHDPTFLRDYREDMTFAGFLRLLESHRLGHGLPADVAPSSFLFAFDHGRIVGRASVRHQLVPPRGELAGHIGYAVLPALRNRGYATRILRQAVGFARDELGLLRVLVTCDEDNAASIRVVEKNHGVFADTYRDSALRRPKRRYWIDTSTAAT